MCIYIPKLRLTKYVNFINLKGYKSFIQSMKHGSHWEKEFWYMLHRGCRLKIMQLLSSILDSISLSDLQLPRRIRKKGRQKGRNFSVIGLPHKKKPSKIQKKILPFKQYSFLKRQIQILTRIVGKSKATTIMNLGEKVGIEDIPKLSQLPNSLLDDNVDSNAVVDFFTSEAWTRLLKLVAQKRVYAFVSLKGSIIFPQYISNLLIWNS